MLFCGGALAEAWSLDDYLGELWGLVEDATSQSRQALSDFWENEIDELLGEAGGLLQAAEDFLNRAGQRLPSDVEQAWRLLERAATDAVSGVEASEAYRLAKQWLEDAGDAADDGALALLEYLAVQAGVPEAWRDELADTVQRYIDEAAPYIPEAVRSAWDEIRRGLESGGVSEEQLNRAGQIVENWLDESTQEGTQLVRTALETLLALLDDGQGGTATEAPWTFQDATPTPEPVTPTPEPVTATPESVTATPEPVTATPLPQSEDVIQVTFPYQGSKLKGIYSDSFFSGSSYQYNHTLCCLSIMLEMSAFTVNPTDNWGEDAADNSKLAKARYANLAEAWKQMGFEHAEYYHYGASLNRVDDKAAYSIARKKLSTGETLVAVVVRGGNYGCEWASNFNVGDGLGNHEGFRAAADGIYAQLLGTMANLKAPLKLWIVGYSRGAAVANLLAGRMDDLADATGLFAPEDIYAYTFATPQGARTSRGLNDALYGNIFNIINPGDVVPKVALSAWGYGRYGVSKVLNPSAAVKSAGRVGQCYRQLTGHDELDPSSGALAMLHLSQTMSQSSAMDTAFRLLQETYANPDEALPVLQAIQDFMQYGNSMHLVDGKWQPYDDCDVFFAETFGEDYLVGYYKAMYLADSIVNEAKILLAAAVAASVVANVDIVDNLDRAALEKQCNTLYTVLGLVQFHGGNCNDVWDHLMKRLAPDDLWELIDLIRDVRTVSELSGSAKYVAYAHTIEFYYAWLISNGADVAFQ